MNRLAGIGIDHGIWGSLFGPGWGNVLDHAFVIDEYLDVMLRFAATAINQNICSIERLSNSNS